MTTVFEGTIDGVIYNSQAEYNEALRAKIKEGKGYSASYSMHTVPDNEVRSAAEDDCECKHDCGGQGCDGSCQSKPFGSHRLPGFNSGQPFGGFLDSISSDYRTNEFNKDSFHKSMDREFESIVAAVNEYTDAEALDEYLGDVENTRKTLSDMEEKNSQAIRKTLSEYNEARNKYDELIARAHECEKCMEDKERALGILRAAAEEIEYVESCYRGISDYISDAIDKLVDEDGDETDGNATVVETNKSLNEILTDSEKKELERTYPGLYRLLNRIFS